MARDPADTPVRVVVCFDKFRGSLSAPRACAALAAGITRARPGAEVLALPVADGGEGTADALLAGAGYQRVRVPVRDPAGQPVTADLAIRADRAVVELAQASGLRPAGDREPLTASTYGTGEMILAALDHGCTEIVLAVGGSATTDGGAGMLTALGARLLDGSGQPVGPGGAGLTSLARIDLTGLDQRLAAVRIILVSDVDSPLLGPGGAAAVFGPQKGATVADVEVLERGLTRFAGVMADAIGTGAVRGGAVRGGAAEGVGAPGSAARDLAAAPGSGAAGGTGFAALTALRAERRPGIDFVLAELGVASRLPGATLAVTGEGRLDSQSLRGKAPAGVARLAAAAGVPLVVVAGQIQLTEAELRSLPCAGWYSLAEAAGDAAMAMARADELLAGVGLEIAAVWLPER